MKKIFLVLLLTVVFTGCARVEETPRPENPADIVRTAVEAYNSGDTEKYLNLLADGFTFNQDPPGMKIEGKAQYEAALREMAGWHQEYSVTSQYEVSGDKVSCTVRETSDELRILGLSEINARCEYQVRNGKIVSLMVVPDSEDWDRLVELNSGGVGISLKFNDEGALVEKLAENSPAAEVGIRTGDIITAVDGYSYTQMRMGELPLRIRGKVGTKVRLTVVRDGAGNPIDIEVTRVDMNQLHISDSQPSPTAEDKTNTPVPDERVEPDSEPSEQADQSDKLDVLDDILGIAYLADGYSALQVLPTAFGLCAQLALLPNGDIALGSYNESVSLLSQGTVRSLVASRGIMTGVAALPDGRVCYCKNDRILAIDPDNGTTELLGTIPTGEGASALATDDTGKIYAATHNNNLYRFNGDGSPAETIARLPFEASPTDIEIAGNGDIYVIGPKLFVLVKPDGQVVTLADDLQNEPAWCEIAPDNRIYVKDNFSGLRLFDSNTGTLSPVELNVPSGVSDFLMPSPEELLFLPRGSDLIISYNLKDWTAIPVAINAVNSEAVAASRDGSVYFATPSLPRVIKSHFLRVYPDGIRQALTEFTFDKIWSADVDRENRLCFHADDKFYRFENNGSLTSFSSVFPAGHEIEGLTRIAIGPDGSWYCITVNAYESTQIWKMDNRGNVTILPVSFDLAFFDDAYQLTGSRIDVGDDGRLAFIVTAVGSKGQGPCYQRVYRAEADGSKLTLIGTFDSSRIGGMFDIAVGPDNEVIVFTCQKETGHFYEMIYRIDNDGNVSRFLEMKAGRDPKGMDMDRNGNVWLCTTVGLFYISH